MKVIIRTFFSCLLALCISISLSNYCYSDKHKVGCQPDYILTVINEPSSGGYISGPGISCGNGATECQQSYSSYDQVQLVATSNKGWIFGGWAEDIGGFKIIETNSFITVNMQDNMTLIAVWNYEVPEIQINLLSPPPNNTYIIDATPMMPNISATAEIIGLLPDPTPTTTFTWNVDLGIGKGNGSVVSLNQYIVQDVLTTGSQVFELGLLDENAVLGGNLILNASALVNGELLEGQSTALAINGTNPQVSDVQNAIDSDVVGGIFHGDSADYRDALKRIACKESGQRQFNGNANGGIGPALVRFDGGVGIFQIVKAGTAAQPYDPFRDPTVIFNWKANVKEGIAVLQEKNGMALYYPGQLRGSSAYQDYIKNNINKRRTAKGLDPLPAPPAPDFSETGLIGSSPPNQLLEDSVRGYNGYWGPHRFGLPLHEFMPNEAVLLTAADSELPHLPGNPNVWLRVPAAERGSKAGDPSYVQDVTDQSPLCEDQSPPSHKQARLGTSGSQALASCGNANAWVFGCGGNYIMADINSGRILAKGIADGIAPDARFDGCLVEDVQVDSRSNTIYALMPAEATFDKMGRRHYRLVALNKSTLKMVASKAIDPALEEVPRFFLDSNKRELVLNYVLPNSESAQPRGVSERYSLPDFKKLNPKNLAQSNIVIAGQVAHFNKRAEIFDDARILDSDSTRKIEEIDGESLLNDAIREKFAALYRTGVRGKKYLDVTFVDSSDDKMIFVVASDSDGDRSPNGSGVIVYDAILRRVVSSFATPYPVTPFAALLGTPTAHLSPNGKLVVIEQYEWSVPNLHSRNEEVERTKTGNLLVFDTDSGSPISEIVLTPPPGVSGRVINFSEDGRVLYYASNAGIYAIDLKNSQVLTTIALEPRFMPIKVLPAKN